MDGYHGTNNRRICAASAWAWSAQEGWYRGTDAPPLRSGNGVHLAIRHRANLALTSGTEGSFVMFEVSAVFTAAVRKSVSNAQFDPGRPSATRPFYGRFGTASDFTRWPRHWGP